MENLKYNKICFIDLETTGVYWNYSRPIQIAAVIFDGKGEVVEGFEEKIKTTWKIDPEASKVHHIYNSDLVNCRSEKEVLTDFMIWLKSWEVDCIIGYNSEAFDCPMLNERCKALRLADGEYFFGKENHIARFDGFKDCVAIARKQNMFNLKEVLGRRWKLTLVADALKINTVHAHDALRDVEILKEVRFTLDPLIHPENWKNEKMVSLF